MQSGDLVHAYVGRTWVAVVVTGLLMGLGIWGIGLAAYRHTLATSAWHPRLNAWVRRDNEVLATLLWTESRRCEV